MKHPLSYLRVVVAGLVITCSLPTFAVAETGSCPQHVNINTADAAQLDQCLKNIGPKTAEAVVAYRTEHGNFKAVQDIAAVKGIGDTRAKKLAPQLTV